MEMSEVAEERQRLAWVLQTCQPQGKALLCAAWTISAVRSNVYMRLCPSLSLLPYLFLCIFIILILYLSLSICLAIYAFRCIFLSLSLSIICLSIYRSVHPCIHLIQPNPTHIINLIEPTRMETKQIQPNLIQSNLIQHNLAYNLQ